MDYDLFFSYSRSNLDVACNLIFRLEKYGLHIWFDRNDVLLGCEIENNIYRVLENAKAWMGMIALVDSEYLTKKWCTMELEYAISNNIYLFPVFINIEKKDLPPDFAFLTAYNIVTIRNSEGIEYAVDKLIDSIIERTNSLINIDTDKTILGDLVNSYKCLPRTNPNKIICADNIVQYLEITHNKEFGHFERFLANVVHQKTKYLYSTDKVSLYDIKIACHAIEKLTSLILIQ